MRSKDLRGFLIVTLVVALVVTGCEPITATAVAPGPGEVAAYGAAAFPSDLFLVDGRIGPLPGLEALAPKETDTLREQLAALDGFGLRPLIELPFQGAVDAGTVPGRTSTSAAPLFLVNVDERSPQQGEVTAVDWQVREGSGLAAGTSTIIGALARGRVLEEGTLYAAIVTTGVRGVGGLLGGSEGLARLRSLAIDDVPREARSTRRALDVIGRSDIVAIAAFTTGTPRRALLQARAILDERPPPTVSFDDVDVIFTGPTRLRELLGTPARDNDGEARLGWSFGTGMAHDHVAAVGTGTLRGITFRQPEGEARERAGGTWVIGDDDRPVVDREVALPVSFAVPLGTMPAGGWPVAFFGHGLGGSRAQMLAFIDSLARDGWATVAIDADGHGLRHTDVDERSNVGARLGADFTGILERRDGFGDFEGTAAALDLFHGFLNIAAMRDQMRQSVVDLSQVVRAMQGGVDLSPLIPGATVDATRIAYLGESFGGVLGSVFSSVEPDVHLFYLDVPGGGVMEYVATNSPALSGFANLFVPPTYGLDPDERLSRFHPLIALGSAVFDGADPLSYAAHALKDRPLIGDRPLGPRSIIIGCVVGDEVLPNSATNALARAYGMPLLGPTVSEPEGIEIVTGPLAGNLDGQTAAMVQFSPANHGDNWSDESGARKYKPFDEDAVSFEPLVEAVATVNPVRAIHEQVRRLLRDHAAGLPPTLVLTDVPRADFDGDGIDDEDDDTPLGATPP